MPILDGRVHEQVSSVLFFTVFFEGERHDLSKTGGFGRKMPPPPPGKPVTFYECHPEDHAPAPSVRADFICSPVHSSKPTRGSRCLAAARNSEWFLSFGSTIRHAIASAQESAATAGYLLLVCRSQIPFRLAQSVFPINTYWTYQLEMDWDMEDASNVRFLAVRGTIWVGDCHTTYNFTLVEYQLYIDEVPWLIFSTLADALEKEFEPNFWGTVNYGRKERWGFLEPPWDGKAYGVAPQYTKMRLSIFNEVAHTMRVVQPFVWNHTHLKVHPNGAMVFHEEKRIAFLLPLIVEAHELLPPKPLFCVNDDNTIPLWRTTLWLHGRNYTVVS